MGKACVRRLEDERIIIYQNGGDRIRVQICELDSTGSGLIAMAGACDYCKATSNFLTIRAKSTFLETSCTM
jgi:Fe-S cluster biogenesis protein NfuA